MTKIIRLCLHKPWKSVRYVGDDWLRFLGDQGIDFVVRLPIRYSKKHVKNYSSLQRKALRRKRAIATPVLWDGYNFQLVMRKNPDDCKDEPILYWMTSLSNAIAASELYRKRWKIERDRPRGVLQMPEDEWLQFPTDETLRRPGSNSP